MAQPFSDTAFITEDGLARLREALGCHVGTLYSPVLTVQFPYVLAPSFAFKVGDQVYLNIENEHRESPSGDIHYGSLSVSLSKYPRGVKLKETKIGQTTTEVLDRLCSVDLAPQQGTFPVRSIDIFEQERSFEVESLRDEQVRYDAAVVFRFGGSGGFYFRPELNGIGHRVEFGQQWRDIWDMSTHLRRRVRITEESIDLDPPPA
ncbi:MAG: hypothetical protein GVY25_10060 [Bacteroidetes bacterium]|jgi:hypothetical protein|nr:hypothetical protein [Bacteroidota bacterium]